MKYVSIDIETLGLNINAPIIEVACVFVDNGEIVGQEHTYVWHDKYDNCEPAAMAMHPETLKIIAKGTHSVDTVHISWLGSEMRSWLIRHRFHPNEGKVMFAGKNAAGFDLPMLRNQCVNFDMYINPHHRVLDPGSMFATRGVKSVPSLNDIIEQERLNAKVTHSAMDDALAVVAAVERFFDLQEEAAHSRYIFNNL